MSSVGFTPHSKENELDKLREAWRSLNDAMGLLAKIFGGVPRDELSGIRLDMSRPFWEVSGKTDFPSLLMALPQPLPRECVLYFEGGSPSGELLKFLQKHRIPERAHVACLFDTAFR